MSNDTYPLPGQKQPQAPSIQVRPRRPNPPPNECFTGTRDEWEEAIFRHAHHFNVFRLHRRVKLGMPVRETQVYPTFPEATADAGPDIQAMVYAVTENGDSFCVPRKLWGHYQQIWEGK